MWRRLYGLQGLPGTRVDEVLGQVGLAAAADRRVREFSLGMRQRSAWPGRCSAIRRCCCSTNPPTASTRPLVGSGLARWLPFSASEAAGRADLTGASRLLPQWGGGLALAGYAVAFAVAAMVTTLRRDVT